MNKWTTRVNSFETRVLNVAFKCIHNIRNYTQTHTYTARRLIMATYPCVRPIKLPDNYNLTIRNNRASKPNYSRYSRFAGVHVIEERTYTANNNEYCVFPCEVGHHETTNVQNNIRLLEFNGNGQSIIGSSRCLLLLLLLKIVMYIFVYILLKYNKIIWWIRYCYYLLTLPELVKKSEFRF